MLRVCDSNFKMEKRKKANRFLPLLFELVHSASAAASCIILIATSMGHLDRYYTSAPIDCLRSFRRERRIAVFSFTNGNHSGTHLSEKRADGEWLGGGGTRSLKTPQNTR